MLARYLYHRTAQLATAVGLLLLLAAFWWLAVSDEQEIQRDSSQRLNDENLMVRRMEVGLGKTQFVANRYNQNLEEIGGFRKNFLEQRAERLMQISSFLETRARERELNLQQVAYTTQPSREEALELQLISLPLAGRYSDIRAFIDDVETSRLFLIVHELSLHDEKSRAGQVEVQLTLATYFQGGSP